MLWICESKSRRLEGPLLVPLSEGLNVVFSDKVRKKTKKTNNATNGCELLLDKKLFVKNLGLLK